jgi:hypothetical protein
MRVDYLHWKYSVTERAYEGGIEMLSRFSNGEKYNNNGTEIN